MEADRIRHRQTAVRMIDGVPHPDPTSTLSLLPLTVVGRWLADNGEAVSGDLLDLGAGNQPFRPWYGPLCSRVVAVDVAPAPGLDVLCFATPLPFRDGAFDAVLSTSVFEHVDDIDGAVAEVARTLRPGGRFVITMPFLYPTHEAPYDFWRTTHLGLRSLLERHGFEVAEIAAQGGPFLLAAHYLLGGLGQLVFGVAAKLGRFGFLIDNRVIRGLIAAPQEAVRSRVSYRSTRFSRAASLGYMTVARKRG